MPYSIFFLRGYAIHGSYETKYLGRPASHGCVRLHPANAAALYSLVQQSWRRQHRHPDRLLAPPAAALLLCACIGHLAL